MRNPSSSSSMSSSTTNNASKTLATTRRRHRQHRQHHHDQQQQQQQQTGQPNRLCLGLVVLVVLLLTLTNLAQLRMVDLQNYPLGSNNNNINNNAQGIHTLQEAWSWGVPPSIMLTSPSSFPLSSLSLPPSQMGSMSSNLSLSLNHNNNGNNNSDSNSNNFDNNKNDTDSIGSNGTLALLYPTGLLGGYRNQVMRFVALVKKATENQWDLLLPSLLWSAFHLKDPHHGHWPVPFEVLFDVHHWNEMAQMDISNGQGNTITTTSIVRIRLPRLVDRLAHTPPPDCWQEPTPQQHQDMDTDLGQSTNSTSSNPNNKVFISPLVSRVLHHHTSWLTPTANVSRDFLLGKLQSQRLRKLDFGPLVEHCTRPHVYGGGTGAGKLWNDYLAMPKLEVVVGSSSRNQHNHNDGNDGDDDRRRHGNTQLIAQVNQALMPAPQWRRLAQRCITHHLQRGNDDNNNNDDKDKPSTAMTTTTTTTTTTPYVALHARVEVDMMTHKCGRDMEKNLTTLLKLVDGFIDTYNTNSPERLRGTFVAVGRDAMQMPTRNADIQALALENWDTLNARSMSYVTNDGGGGDISNTNISATYTLDHRGRDDENNHKIDHLPAVFECGEGWVQEAYYRQQSDLPDDYYGSILPSMINFHLALHAEVFVGVAKSSWSTDVWTTRYWMGRGSTNYQYTSDRGIVPVPNNGLPPAHKSC